MSYWRGERIKVFYINGASEVVTVVECRKGQRGWRIVCRPQSCGCADRIIWDTEGGDRTPKDPVVGIRRTGDVQPL